MIIGRNNKRMTANQKAKQLVDNALSNIICDWEEDWVSESEQMSDAEKRKIDIQITKRVISLRKYLNYKQEK